MSPKEECLTLIPKLLEESDTVTQISVAIEEMSELTKALIKNNFRNKDNINDVFEELGDVLFCINTIMHIYKTNEHELFTMLYKKLLDRGLLENKALYDVYVKNDIITTYCFGVDNDINSGITDIKVEHYSDPLSNSVGITYYRDGQIVKVVKDAFDYIISEYYKDNQIIQRTRTSSRDGSIDIIEIENV